MPTPTVSIIVPVYNAQRYLQACLDSLYAQTFDAFEIIAVNDGSTDESWAILQANASSHQNVQIIKQDNHGQGYARNRALEMATGKYILFVDADDYIETDLLQQAVTTAEEDDADVVNFNWQLLVTKPNGVAELQFFNTEYFAGKRLLQGDACDEFLQKNNYFSCDSLYLKAFLDEHQIRFGEGYIYEDNEFIVSVASYARTIAIIDRPLYVVRQHGQSSTRLPESTDKHYRDFMRAIKRSYEVLVCRTPYSAFYLTGYFLEKFIVYYERRVPRQYRPRYLRDFVDIVHGQTLQAPAGHRYKFLRTCIKRNIFASKKYHQFYIGLQYKTRLLPARNKLKSSLSKLQHH